MSQGQKNSGRPCGRLMSLRHFQHVMLFSAPSERRTLVQYVTNRLAVRRNIALLIERRHRGIQAVTMIVQSYAYVTWNHRSYCLWSKSLFAVFFSLPILCSCCSLRFLEHLVSILMYPTSNYTETIVLVAWLRSLWQLKHLLCIPLYPPWCSPSVKHMRTT